MKVSTFGIFIS